LWPLGYYKHPQTECDREEMADEKNPYRPPLSSLESLVPEVLSEVQLSAMNRVARLADRTGKIFLFYACTFPGLTWWQAHNLLSKYGAEDKVGMVVGIEMERAGLWLLGLAVMAGMMVKASTTIRRGQAAGLRLVAVGSAGAILIDLVNLAVVQATAPLAVLLRCAWWAYLLYAALRANRLISG
jgi:hypothetical protein